MSDADLIPLAITGLIVWAALIYHPFRRRRHPVTDETKTTTETTTKQKEPAPEVTETTEETTEETSTTTEKTTETADD